jgi:hypothetical protein
MTLAAGPGAAAADSESRARQAAAGPGPGRPSLHWQVEPAGLGLIRAFATQVKLSRSLGMDSDFY